jgi:hypothetical protein
MFESHSSHPEQMPELTRSMSQRRRRTCSGHGLAVLKIQKLLTGCSCPTTGAAKQLKSSQPRKAQLQRVKRRFLKASTAREAF